MKNKLIKQIVFAFVLVVFVLGGCGNSNTQNNSADNEEYLEGYDNLSEEETTQKLVEEADQMEVVPDNKE